MIGASVLRTEMIIFTTVNTTTSPTMSMETGMTMANVTMRASGTAVIQTHLSEA